MREGIDNWVALSGPVPSSWVDTGSMAKLARLAVMRELHSWLGWEWEGKGKEQKHSVQGCG